jgi:hypothetical protein
MTMQSEMLESRGNRIKAAQERALPRFGVRAEVPAPPREEARRRILSKPGFFASLSPDAWATIENFDGPEVIGPPRRKR